MDSNFILRAVERVSKDVSYHHIPLTKANISRLFFPEINDMFNAIIECYIMSYWKLASLEGN